MSEADQGLLTRALALAAKAHAGQTRKGGEIPYLSHLLQVAGLVLSHGGSAESAAIGLLHDTIEDCPEVSFETLKAGMGERIAEGVLSLSDLVDGDAPDRKSPWLDRKQQYLRQLEVADSSTRLVAACDKLDNLRCLVSDLELEGMTVMERFNGSPAQTRWYYESVRTRVDDAMPDGLKLEIDRLLARLADFVPAASSEA